MVCLVRGQVGQVDRLCMFGEVGRDGKVGRVGEFGRVGMAGRVGRLGAW